ncbi:MAG: hypothetical protein SOI04_03600 [Bifidobacterium thermacidophilum]|jgi:hypothetical protein|uniref:hypothetical protein n=1 Tax=Bifidobacterium thermacidophilum TaxID=246618 RepID=UPI002F358EAD
MFVIKQSDEPGKPDKPDETDRKPTNPTNHGATGQPGRTVVFPADFRAISVQGTMGITDVDNGVKRESISGRQSWKTAKYQGFRPLERAWGVRHNHS